MQLIYDINYQYVVLDYRIENKQKKRKNFRKSKNKKWVPMIAVNFY